MIGFGQGQWIDERDTQQRLTASTLSVGPVFYGEISPGMKDDHGCWRAILNGEYMGGYSTMGGAKARIDWEVWNRVRQMREGYKVLLDRREHWKDGGGCKYRSPEYLGIPGEKSNYPSLEAADVPKSG